MPPRKKKPEPEAEAFVSRETPEPDSDIDDVIEVEELPGGVNIAMSRRRRGRPVHKWNPQFVQAARLMIAKGCTTWEIAEAFGVTERQIYRWRATYDDFNEAFRELGQLLDERVERTLFERAVGYHYAAEKPAHFKGITFTIPYTAYVPGDVAAMKHWLAVKRPAEWRVKEEVAVSGDEAFKELLIGMANKKKDGKE